MTKAEMETVIRWDREELLVHIWTADKTVMRKLDRLGVPVKEEIYAQRTGEVTGRFYQPIPLARFRFGLKRERTAAQAAAARKGAFSARTPAAAAHPDESTGVL